jgi:hypothetical protein
MTPNALKQAKSIGIIAAVAGTLFAANAHMIVTGIHDVNARGVEAVANVEGGTVSSGRRGSGTSLRLSWVDGSGRLRRESVDISGALAERIIAQSTLKVAELVIRYVPGEPNTKPIVVADAAHRLSDNQTNRNVFAGLAILGALVSAGLALADRRGHAMPAVS